MLQTESIIFTEIIRPAGSTRRAESKGGTTMLTPQEVAEHGFSTSDQRQILIGQLGLPTQLSNALQRGGLNSVADILAFENKESLLAIRNLGDQRYEELIRELETRGYDVSHLK